MENFEMEDSNEPWPTPSVMKNFTSWETELIESEIPSNLNLFYAERDLKFLKKSIERHYKNLSDHIEGIRSSRTLSQKKINAFTMECQIVNSFFQFSIDILVRLANFLLGPQNSDNEKYASLSVLYNTRLKDFHAKFGNFAETAIRYVSIPLYSDSVPVRFQVRRLPAFKTAFQEVSTSFLSVLTPLQCSFSLKMMSIREKREKFFKKQLVNVAESVGDVGSIAAEIQSMEERRIQLESSSNDLDRLFSIMGKIMARRSIIVKIQC